MRFLLRALIVCLLAGTAFTASAQRAHAEAQQVRIAIQYGLQYLPLLIIAHDDLLADNVEAAGLPRPEVSWTTFSGGDILAQALLSGQVDIINGGLSAFLTLWSKTKGDQKVMALAPFNSLPVTLVTRDPDIHSIEDYTDEDRIALPAVRLSGNALLLEMEAAKVFGEDQWDKLDHLTVSRSQPDAYAAFIDPNSEISSHFGNSPYTELELKQPGAHIVLTERDVLGGQTFSGGLCQTTVKFVEENPKTAEAFVTSLMQAMELIETDKERAAQIYLKMARDTKNSVADIVELLSNENMIYDPTPLNVMKFADFMNFIGQINVQPADWKELFFPYVHNLNGS